MHAEYKVPGGKLVVVDLELSGDSISAARVAGDFFLEPDEALDDINAAIVGLSSQSSHEHIEQAVRAALPADAVLLGFDPSSVATVVRRALSSAKNFTDYDWSYLAPQSLEPLQQMALDQVLTEQVGAGERGPTLRIWEWAKPAVVIGSFQSLRNEVDMEGAQKYGMEVTRRISGGGAMFMELGTAITYSLYAPIDLVQGMSFQDSYAFLDDWVVQALRGLGIDASYRPLNDIQSPSGKIGGAAQKRLGSERCFTTSPWHTTWMATGCWKCCASVAKKSATRVWPRRTSGLTPSAPTPACQKAPSKSIWSQLSLLCIPLPPAA